MMKSIQTLWYVILAIASKNPSQYIPERLGRDYKIVDTNHQELPGACPPNCVRKLLCNLRSFNDRRVDWTRRSRFPYISWRYLFSLKRTNLKNYIVKKKSGC